MDFKEFIEKYDKIDNIILLEGKRAVLENDNVKLIELGKLLASSTKHMIFRSGNANGADELFAKGVVEIDQKRFQVITPSSGHRKKHNNAYETFSLSEIDLLAEPEVVYQSKKHKETEKLIEPFVNGQKNKIILKAGYIIRDTVKVIGTKKIRPANFGIFYDDLSNPMKGGTGHTMNICKMNNVPIIDQTIWFKWL
jgi:hypothetical protein